MPTFGGSMMHGNEIREATRVLVVEDEPSARDAMQRFLQYCGYSVSVAASANEAIKQATRCPPDILVCDWKLDGEGENKGDTRDAGSVDAADGVDTAVDLQRRYRTAVILVTAHQLDALKSKARKTGLNVSVFRRKPLSLTRLANDIASLQGNAET